MPSSDRRPPNAFALAERISDEIKQSARPLRVPLFDDFKTQFQAEAATRTNGILSRRVATCSSSRGDPYAWPMKGPDTAWWPAYRAVDSSAFGPNLRRNAIIQDSALMGTRKRATWSPETRLIPGRLFYVADQQERGAS